VKNDPQRRKEHEANAGVHHVFDVHFGSSFGEGVCMRWSNEQLEAHLNAHRNKANLAQERQKKENDAQRSRSKPVARSKRVLKVLTEDQEQITLMSWARRVKFGNGRLSDYLIHIPNGGSRNIIEAAKFKKMGVKAGVPDLQLLVPNGLIHGLWIELKSKTGKLQPSQRLMMQRLEEQGYLCKVCFGADEAINEIKKYLCLNGGE